MNPTRRPVAARPSDAELRRLYLDESLSSAAIARGLGCDPTTVRHWLVAADIPTRPRGDIANLKGKRRAPDWRPSADARAKIGAASKARWESGAMAGRKHWLKGAPPQMNPRWLGGVTPERQAFYASRAWKEACVTVWWRSDACCERCSADARRVRRSEGAFHVHHIVSFKVAALRADPGNLALLCRDCHLWVHSGANADRDWIATEEAGPQTWWAIHGARWDAQAERAMAAANDPDPFGLRYLMAAEFEARQPTLFDVLDAGRNQAEAA